MPALGMKPKRFSATAACVRESRAMALLSVLPCPRLVLYDIRHPLPAIMNEE
jgi:hypothetical protein